MFKISVSFENEAPIEKIKEIQREYIRCHDSTEVLTKYTDWVESDEAFIRLAIDMGWDIDHQLRGCEEDLYECFDNDVMYWESARAFLIGSAIEYIESNWDKLPDGLTEEEMSDEHVEEEPPRTESVKRDMSAEERKTLERLCSELALDFPKNWLS